MIEWVTQRALVGCRHMPLGRVELNRTQQTFVRIARELVLVEDDPLYRTITGCTYSTPAGQMPCTQTIFVEQGHSRFIRIAERPIVLASLEGRTSGATPGTVRFTVRDPGQRFVREVA